ncbi:MAG: hypothetical protein CNCCGFBP_00200 [Fimbriimonadaceae bacterium]|nr:hypothetical protein [Fimbriimonadaceae bacterium]
MTDDERLLETCIHEAAHFAFAVWANTNTPVPLVKVHEIAIGERELGGYVSGGSVMWSMLSDIPLFKVGAIAGAGKAIDIIRAHLTTPEIDDGASFDVASLRQNIENTFGAQPDDVIKTTFEEGVRTATANLTDKALVQQIECLGRRIYSLCNDGVVSITGSDLQVLWNACLPT